MGKLNSTLRRLLEWVDARFPLSALWRRHFSEYYVPRNLNFWYIFGALALLMLVLQVVTGIFLAMHYKPDASINASGVPVAFASVEVIMRDVPWGWLIRYLHSTGASVFFVVVYLHVFCSLLYGSYRKPRELVWLLGVLIFMCLMAVAFSGYVLSWGQMSYWGAQVIMNLFSTIPVVGPDLAIWLRGDSVVGDATLGRCFAMHVIAVPLVLIGLVMLHVVALRQVGANNPDGVEFRKMKDGNTGIPFHPYYTVKLILGLALFLLPFSAIVFFMPEFGGYFLEYNNFIPADPLHMPEFVAPMWYFSPFYSILRAVTPDFVIVPGLAVTVFFFWVIAISRSSIKFFAALLWLLAMLGFYFIDAGFWGSVAMVGSVLVWGGLPWLDHSPVRSIRYKGFYAKLALAFFVASFLVLGYLGMQPPTCLLTLISQAGTVVYFAFFLLMPVYTRMDKCKTEPERQVA